jgi:hypothetical protein
MSKSTEGIVYAGRAILEALRSGLEVATRVNARTSPSQGCGDDQTLSRSTAMVVLTARCCGTRKLLRAAWGLASIKRYCRQGQGWRTAGLSSAVTAL